MVEAFIPSLRLGVNLLNTFRKIVLKNVWTEKKEKIMLLLQRFPLVVSFFLLIFFFLSQTTLSDAHMHTNVNHSPVSLSLSIPLSPSLRSMSDAVVLFDCLGKVQW